MLYFNALLGINDYESFKQVRERIAPIRTMGDGNKTQPKRLVWKLLTSRQLFTHRNDGFAEWYYKNSNLSLLEFENQSYKHAKKMSERKAIAEYVYDDDSNVRVDGILYGIHPTYKLDDRKGICFDKDVKCIRHTNTETNRPDQKIKAGKWYRKMITYSGFSDMVPESWTNHLCEIFANRWETWAMQSIPDVKLVVDRDFHAIYDKNRYTPDNNDFESCMSSGNYGLGHHEFYEECTPDAMAASIRDANGYILARCVVFNNVMDGDTGEIFRLAERQYASGGNDILKSLLVAKLYDEGYIDGHKKVGACSGSVGAFVAKDGTDLSGRRFSIECNVNYDSVCCYQDSFKWSDGKIAWNYYSCHNDNNYELSVTQMHVGYEDDEEENYDEYHDEYTHDNVISVYYRGEWIDCSEERLDDFVHIEGYINHEVTRRHEGYYHEDDVTYCDKDYCYYLNEDVVLAYDTDEYILYEDSYYSELLSEYYYDEEKMKKDEEEYAEKHGFVYDDYNSEWIWKENAVKVFTFDGTEYCSKHNARIRERNGFLVAILMDADDDDSLVYMTNEYYELHFNAA